MSIVVPAYNAARTIADCLHSATGVRWEGELEVIVVNDGSSDATSAISSSLGGVRVIDLPNGGAARATNRGIEAARHDLIVLLDADATLQPEWLDKVSRAFNSPRVAAVGGYAATANRSAIGRIAGYDVESRLARASIDTDHLSTMNTAYRRQALIEAGMLDEGLKAAYDVDLSFKLKAAGYQLLLRKDAVCGHLWRDSLAGYMRQQYGYAYWRMEVALRNRRAHDQFTRVGMLLHVPFAVSVLLAAVLGSLATPAMALLLLLLPASHLLEMLALLPIRRQACILLLPLLFTIRDLCWAAAAVHWGAARGAPRMWINLARKMTKRGAPRSGQRRERPGDAPPAV